MQHCPGRSEMEETEGQSGLSCSQRKEVSITFSQILLSFLDSLSLSAPLWFSLFLPSSLLPLLHLLLLLSK